MRRFANLALVTAASAEILISEPFSGSLESSSWKVSGNSKFEGTWVVGKSQSASADSSDSVLIMEKKGVHSAISSSFPSPLNPSEKTVVVQYEVRFNQHHSCGGAYLKLLEDGQGFTPETFHDKSSYSIMFGPDKCGQTDKVHFIFRHKNPVSGLYEEKHLTSPPSIKNDQQSHLYTLTIKPDSTYDIAIDRVSVKSGSLLSDFSPAVNPPREINDPADSKPVDWVDETEIPDPSVSKPVDWDNEPELIADPEAQRPSDWSDQDDGAWEAPLVENANYKGEWRHPMVANPAYKGEWAPRKIANPEFFEVTKATVQPIGAVGLELWSMEEGIEFDNVFVGTSETEAAKAAELWVQTSHKQSAHKEQQDKLDELTPKGSSIVDYLNDKVATAVSLAQENPISTVLTATVGLLLLGWALSKEDPDDKKASDKTEVKTEAKAAEPSKPVPALEESPKRKPKAKKESADTPATPIASPPLRVTRSTTKK